MHLCFTFKKNLDGRGGGTVLVFTLILFGSFLCSFKALSLGLWWGTRRVELFLTLSLKKQTDLSKSCISIELLESQV